MSNELTTINNALLPSQQEFNMFQIIAKNAQGSGLYGGVGGEAKIFMILLAARELGIPPMQALNGSIWNIQGKIEISARCMNSMIRRAGHSMKIISTDKECTIIGKRSDTGEEHTEVFTWSMGEKAGLTNGNVWKKYPEDMLYNRCMSRFARKFCPDVIGSAYVEGEIKEAKEVEKLEQVECVDITRNYNEKVEEVARKPNISLSQTQPEQNSVAYEDPMKKYEVKITNEQAETLGELYSQTDKEFRKNFGPHMEQKWGAFTINDIPAICYDISFKAMTNNVNANKNKVVA